MEGLPEAAKISLNLQLSSPIEEGTLTAILDPTSEEPAPEGSLYTFKGVETSTATLTLSAKDADIPLGSSAPHDLAPLCALEPMGEKTEYVSELPIAIVPDSSDKPAAVADSEKPSSEQSPAASEEVPAEDKPVLPTCTVTLRITYKPSPKDQREELYELLNKTSQRKATALDNLRKISTAVSRSGATATPAKGSTAVAKPAVKPGFLNKKKEPTRLERLYERTLGPNSLLRQSLGVAIFARNYIIFFGAVSFFHFKGQLLSIPPPV